jgi:glyoxylase-like metal-dependent hydrolase (beta-lactamase superfamily II)
VTDARTTDITPSPGDWTEPGAFEVAPGVHRIPLPLPNDGLRAVNVYAVTDGDGLVLVDAGWNIPEAADLLAGALATMDCGLGDIRRFLVTHVHRDHYTQAVEIRRSHGTPISLGVGERGSLEVMRQANRRAFEPQLRQLERCGAAKLVEEITSTWGGVDGPEADRSIWELPDDWLRTGPLTLDAGRELQVVETPGHTIGHVVFHDPAAAILFAGDHVLPTITPSIGFEAVLSPDPLGAFLESLATVRAMPDAQLLPAHGHVAPSVHERIDQLVDHHGRRLDEAEAVVGQGVPTAFGVAGQLRWTRRQHHLEELDPFNRMLATTETGAHLDLLAAQGRLAVDLVDGVRHYSPA